MKLIYLISRVFLAWTFLNFLAHPRGKNRIPGMINDHGAIFDLETKKLSLKIVTFFNQFFLQKYIFFWQIGRIQIKIIIIYIDTDFFSQVKYE